MTNAKKAKAQRRQAGRRPPQKKSSANTWLAIGAGVFVLIVVAVILTSGGGGAGPNEPSDPGTVSIDREPGPTLVAGEAIPDWSAPSLAGDGTIAWGDYVGSPTVLAIWAPWCPHCQAELPRLAEALQTHPDVQLVTISTAVEQGGTGSQEYLDSVGLSFPVAVDDADTTLMQGLGVEGFPGTYFVNADGTVFTYVSGEIGLQPDGTVDDAVLDGLLGDLEAANAAAEA
jgi:thiol-disulfide isomerase/thioredoxin